MDYLCLGGSRLLRVISSRPIIAVKSIRPKVPPLLKDNLRFALPHLLVLFDSLVLVDSIHELAHAGDRFPSQGLPQTVLYRQASLECADGDVIVVSLYLVIHLPIPIRVGFQGLSFSYGQGQERI